MKLSRLEIDIARKNIVENDVLDEVGTVILFIIILLDAGEGHAEQLRVFLRILVGSLHKDSIVVLGAAAKGLVSIAVDHKGRGGAERFGIDTLVDLTDFSKLGARDDNGSFVNHADCSVNSILHLMHYTLK